MAKRKGRRRRPYLGGRIDHKLQLGTLAATTLIGSLNSDALTEKAFCSSIDCTWGLQGMTDNTDDGPIVVGVAHGDYSDAEVEAWFELEGSWEEGALIEKEISNRKCRIVGTFEGQLGPDQQEVLGDGRRIKTKLNWQLLTGQTLRFWAYNAGASALATTDPALFIKGKANLWPN